MSKGTSSPSISVRPFRTSLYLIHVTYASIYCCIRHTGGTNLRVCLVTVQGDGQFEITQSKYRLTEEQKQDEGQKLFDFCAESLKTFVDTNLAVELKPGDVLPLGFTVGLIFFFVFPVPGC
jgi:hexokinase